MLIDEELMQTIVKWAFIVFVAGFIGQFGKSLTKHIIARLRKRKTVIHAKTAKKDKKLSKIEKKRQKAEIKRRKKGK